MSDRDGMSPSPAQPEEQAAAFGLLFQHCSPDVQARRIARARKMLFTGEIDPRGLFVLRREGEIVGAVLGLTTAGGIGMVWPVQTGLAPQPDVIEDTLARHVITWLREQGHVIGQCLLHPDEAHLIRPLERHGFQHTTTLWHLRLGLESRVDSGPVSGRLEFQSVAASAPELFHETLRRTYEETLDFPEITAAISLEQAVAGHRGLGSFRPDRWWLAFHENEPVGVLLLNEIADEPAWEIAYLGVVQGVRGRGFGRELVNKAMAEVQAAGASEIILTVDRRNALAWQLYRSAGFEAFDSREVFLANWATP